MSERFRIHKTGSPTFPWAVDYPTGFSDREIGQACSTFQIAVATLADLINRQCPVCLKGAVADRDWGWECESCGSSDVAVGCERPR